MRSHEKSPGAFVNKYLKSRLPNSTENELESVSTAFGLISTRTNYNSFNEKGTFDEDEYTTAHNHFQGIQRLKDGQHFVISGGSKREKAANLIFCKADNYGHSPNSSEYYAVSRIESAIGSNVIHEKIASDKDNVVGIYQLNKWSNRNNKLKDYWHAGGMDVCGDILVVPLENSKEKKSIIRFYDVSDFNDIKFPIKSGKTNKPKLIAEHPIKGNSGAVALTKRADGKFLLASWTDSDDDPHRFDFYISKKINDLAKWEKKIPFHYNKLVPEYDQEPKFQAINFVRQKDGKLFLVGTGNTNKAAPFFGGTHYANLYEVIYFKDGKNNRKFHLIRINQREFKGGGFFANFGGGAGIYVNSKNKMAIYSAHHWRRKSSINIGEYWPVLEPNHKKIFFKRDLIIELYEHTHFKGKVLRLFDEKDSSMKNFDKIFVEGIDFGDRISSMRLILPEGYKFCLYPDKKHKGKAEEFEGTGYYEEREDLFNFGDEFSSCKIENIIKYA